MSFKQVSVNDKVHSILKNISDEDNVSMSSLIENMVRFYMETKEQQNAVLKNDNVLMGLYKNCFGERAEANLIFANEIQELKKRISSLEILVS